MKYYISEYPSFDEIKDDLTKEDLKDIVEAIMELGLSKVDNIIKNFIEANYEPTRVRDIDRERDEMIDEEMRNES